MSEVQASAAKAMMIEYLVNRAGVDPRQVAEADARLDSLGIDSLSTVEMLWELEEKLGVHVAETHLLPQMTLDELAQFVAAGAMPPATPQAA